MSVLAPTRRLQVKAWRGAVVPYLFLAPCLLFFLVFRVYPLLYGLFVSFTDARMSMRPPSFVGLENYLTLLEDTRFQGAAINTLVYTLESTLPILGLPFLLAVALDRGIPLRALLRAIFFFPFTLSVVTVGVTWQWILDPVSSPVSYYLRLLGLPSRAWLGDPTTAMWCIVVSAVWTVTGYYLVIYLAALQDIPRHLYEAAAIDGAGAWRRLRSITMPLLQPIFLLVVILHIIGSFQIFGLVYVMTVGGPGSATRTVVQHLFEVGFRDLFDLGSAAAVSWVLFVAILVFSVAQFRLFRGRSELG